MGLNTLPEVAGLVFWYHLNCRRQQHAEDGLFKNNVKQLEHMEAVYVLCMRSYGSVQHVVYMKLSNIGGRTKNRIDDKSKCVWIRKL